VSKGKKRIGKKYTKEEHDKKIGSILITPVGSAAGTLAEIYSQADFIKSIDDLHMFMNAVKEGGTGFAFSMLVSQMTVLNAVFNTKIQAARKSDTIDEGNYHADIAFRAQNQCNRTMRTLLELQNPKRATFIKQQNNLQVNQGESEKEKKVKPTNELLEHDHESRLDFGKKKETSGSHKEMEAVESVNRTED